MPYLEKYLQVKKSTLPAAGKGLFTKKTIRKGEKIIEYKGRVTTWKKASLKNIENPFIFYISRNLVIDALSYPKAMAKYANDARGLIRVKGIVNNSEYKVEHNHVFVQAIKTIPAGSEIFVSYGKEYWDIIKYNQKIADDK